MRQHVSDRPRRRPLRLKGYDYSQPGAYFVTVCTQNLASLFGRVEDGVMGANDAGKMVLEVWDAIPDHYAGVGIDAFVVMPNHIHGIITLSDGEPEGGHGGAAPTIAKGLSFPDLLQRFKSLTTAHYSDGVEWLGWPTFDRRLWQRSYYDRVVRSESELQRVREYILHNPLHWSDDEKNPSNL